MAGASSQTFGTVLKVKLNERSSLHRTWTVLNDPSCPVQLIGAGIATSYQPSGYSGRYLFRATGSAKTSKTVQALQIRYLLYDVFGTHLRTLSNIEVTDLPAGATYILSESGDWSASETEVSQLLTVVAFVAQVRGEDGSVWRYSQKAIEEELGRVRLTVEGAFGAATAKVK